MRTLALAVVTSALLATQAQAGLFFSTKSECKPAPACKPAPVCNPAPVCAKPCPIKCALKPVKLPKLCLPKIDLLSLFKCNNGGGAVSEEDIPESDLGEAAEEGAIEESAADAAPAPAVKDAPAPPKEAPAPPKEAPAPPKADATTAAAKAPYVEKAAVAEKAAAPAPPAEK